MEFHRRNGKQRSLYYSKCQCSGSITYSNADTHSYSYGNTYSYGNSYSYSNTYSYGNTDLNAKIERIDLQWWDSIC